MTEEVFESLRTRHKHFATHLADQFGLGLADLSEARINEIEEPRRTWLLWGLQGFERAELTYSCVAQLSPRSGGRHLDVGCGTGYLCAAFAKHDFESVGIDIGDLTHARLQQLDFPDKKLSFHNLDLLKDDSSSLGLFDVITLDNTIEHIESPSIMISRLRSLLAKGGVIYLIIPNSHWIETVRSDPHYRQFGISLLDKHDGDAMLEAVTDSYTSYDVNNWFCRYRFEHYASLFRKYGFEPTVSYHDRVVGVDEINHAYVSFDLAAIQREFQVELAKLEGKMPGPLFEKLKYVVEQYLADMENDYTFVAGSEGAMIEQGKLSFAQTYLFGTWFMLLRPMADTLSTGTEERVTAGAGSAAAAMG